MDRRIPNRHDIGNALEKGKRYLHSAAHDAKLRMQKNIEYYTSGGSLTSRISPAEESSTSQSKPREIQSSAQSNVIEKPATTKTVNIYNVDDIESYLTNPDNQNDIEKTLFVVSAPGPNNFQAILEKLPDNIRHLGIKHELSEAGAKMLERFNNLISLDIESAAEDIGLGLIKSLKYFQCEKRPKGALLLSGCSNLISITIKDARGYGTSEIVSPWGTTYSIPVDRVSENPKSLQFIKNS